MLRKAAAHLGGVVVDVVVVDCHGCYGAVAGAADVAEVVAQVFFVA